jgi:ankyrin repeat-rich membrane spanning protein
VKAHGNYHISSLLWAAGRGHVDIAKALIGHGAKINVGDKVCKWKLQIKLYASCVQHVFNHTVNLTVNVYCSSFCLQYGTTALVWACRKGSVDIVDSLLKAGANVDTAGMVIFVCIFVII